MVAVIEDAPKPSDAVPFPFVDALAAARKRDGLANDPRVVREAVQYLVDNGWVRLVPYLRETDAKIEVQLTHEGRAQDQPIRGRHIIGVSLRPTEP